MRSPFLALRFVAFALATALAAHAYSKLGGAWPTGNIPIVVQLDATAPAVPTFPLTDGTRSWNSIATLVMDTWNTRLTRSKFTYTVSNSTAGGTNGDRTTQVFFANTIYGRAWGSNVLAVTLYDNENTARVVEADLIVNKNFLWDSYRGSLVGTAEDLRRVLLHEFGHVLGLDHPDQARPVQNVNAIMNSVISDTDALTPDDIAGVTYLYNTSFTRPTITRQPTNQTATVAGTAQLTVAVDNQDPPVPDDFHSYHWYFKATGETEYEQLFTLIEPGSLSFNIAQLDDAGTYQFRAITPDAVVTSTPVTLSVNPVTANPAARLSNLSTRGTGGSSDRAMIVGFVVTGSRSKSVLLRAAGPGLATFGVPGILPDPQLVLKDSSGVTIASSTAIWDQSDNVADIRAAAARVGAFAFADGTHDAALLLTLAPGTYTAAAASPSRSVGTVLIEAYDADVAPDSSSRLANLSTRGYVTTDSNTLIAGFTVAGPGPRNYLVRIGGDTLIRFGVAGTLDDPYLSLYSGQTLVREKDDWDSPASAQPALRSAFTSVGAFTFADRQEPAMIVTLPPGSYSAKATGLTNNGSTSPVGNAIIEIYELP